MYMFHRFNDACVDMHVCRLCCVLAVNMMVYLRLITSSQSGTSPHSPYHGDVNLEDVKL